MPGTVGPKAAAVIIRAYYAAIDTKNYRRAYRYWDSEGAASDQAFEAFRSGFAETTGGQQQRFVGTYTLRRAVVDGASPRNAGGSSTPPISTGWRENRLVKSASKT